MDIVRTKAQVFTQYGAIDTLKYILKRDGVRGLMTGVSAVRPPALYSLFQTIDRLGLTQSTCLALAPYSASSRTYRLGSS